MPVGHHHDAWEPIIEGFRFHDLRHTRRTWMLLAAQQGRWLTSRGHW